MMYSNSHESVLGAIAVNFNDYPHWVYALQLKRTSKVLKQTRKRNPDYSKAILYIGCHTEDPDSYSKSLDRFIKNKKIPAPKRLRKDLLHEGPLKRETAFKRHRETIEELRKRGFGVYNPSPKKTSKVYVILLSDTVKEKISPEQRGKKNKPCVYVGETTHTPRCRYAIHKQGDKTSSKWVKNYGIELLEEFIDGPLYKDQALRKERLLAQKLRKKGYTVLGGH
jgi:hypothetical protein